MLVVDEGRGGSSRRGMGDAGRGVWVEDAETNVSLDELVPDVVGLAIVLTRRPLLRAARLASFTGNGAVARGGAAGFAVELAPRG